MYVFSSIYEFYAELTLKQFVAWFQKIVSNSKMEKQMLNIMEVVYFEFLCHHLLRGF
jgi:hypothetical protein